MRLNEITTNIAKKNANTYTFTSGDQEYILGFSELGPRVAEVAFSQVNSDVGVISNTYNQGSAAIAVFRTVAKIIKDELPNYDQLEFSTTADRATLYRKMVQAAISSTGNEWKLRETTSSSDGYILFIITRNDVDNEY